MLCHAVRGGDRAQVRQLVATARAAGIAPDLVDAIRDLGKPQTLNVRPAQRADRRSARALGLPLVGEIDGTGAPMSPAAQQVLGIGFGGDLVEALARITGLPADHATLTALVSEARERGEASGLVEQGRLAWRLHVYTEDEGLRAMAAPAGGGDARELETLATINHEMANGLTALASLASMARHPANGPALVADALRRIEQTAHETLRSVKSTRRALRTRPPEGLTPAQDIAPVLRDLLERFGSVASDADVELEVRVADELHASARPADLRSILWNLVKNAIEATGKGGRVRVGATAVAERIRLVVDDDGEGMSEATQRRAFEAYYTTKETGTGLGLPLVKHLVDRMGGELVLESEVGHGTRIVVSLPRAMVLDGPVTSGVRRRFPLQGLDVLILGERAAPLRDTLEVLGARVRELEAVLDTLSQVDVAFLDGHHGPMLAGPVRDVAKHMVWIGERPSDDVLVDAILSARPTRDELCRTLETLYPGRLAEVV